MCLKQREPLSGNLMTRAGSFQKAIKTNHDSIYSEKEISFLGMKYAHGSNNRRINERNILY